MKKIVIICLFPLSSYAQTLKSTGQFGIANAKMNGVKKIMLQKSSGLGGEKVIGNHLYFTLAAGAASIEFDIPDFVNDQRIYHKQKFLFLQTGIKKYYPVSRKSYTSLELGPLLYFRYKMQTSDSINTYENNIKVLSASIATAFTFSTAVSAKWNFEIGLNKQDDVITKNGFEKIKRTGVSITLHRKI